MDFIHYNPSKEPLLADDESTDEMDFDDLAIQYGEVQMLIDMDTIPIPERQSYEMEEIMEDLVEKFQEVTIKSPAKYKKYGQNQIERFIRMIQEEGLTVPKAAEQCGIPRSSAYKLLNEFNASDGSVLPGNIPKKLEREPKKLFSQHSAFLIELFDNNPSIVLEEARLKLYEHFDGLEISISGLYKHISERSVPYHSNKLQNILRRAMLQELSSFVST